MTQMTFLRSAADTLPLTLLTPDTIEHWKRSAPPAQVAWAEAQGFNGGFGQVAVFADADGTLSGAVGGLGPESARRRKRFALAAIRQALPPAPFHLTGGAELPDAGAECLGWLLAGYGFTRYAGELAALAQLVAPDGIDADALEVVARGEATTRDLINTPANDMGPDALEAAIRTMGDAHGAEVTTITGDDLLARNYPLIHTVGRAAARAPRLIDLRWGDSGPKLTLVGKGVCFDTGGLNLKPGASMGLMKKDMGGAATVIGLASMIMEARLPLRLRVLVPAVENAVAGNAFRPGDILTSRKGLTVEINNTDAEGRLVLADALDAACADDPDLLISMATLTGAARVAVGPDLAPFYTDDDALASALAQGAGETLDPVWRMPFWDPYETMIEPGIADLDNAPSGGFAGSITAALFLRRFVSHGTRYAHFDIYGWTPTAAPARPKGGVGQGARALLAALPALLDL